MSKIKSKTKENKSAYIVLRRQLPYDQTFQSSLEELIAYCKRIPINAVSLFTVSQELFHPTTESLENAEDAVSYLSKAGMALRQSGVGFQLQLIGVIGHGDFGAPKPRWANWQTMVGDDGAECNVCPCPRDVSYHKHLRHLCRIYARLKPDVLWLDDDFRMHNHDPADYVCFCPNHLTEFSKRMGRKYERDELVEAVLRPGAQPTDERRVWFSLLGEDLVCLASIIEEEVHCLSPETRLGDMTSGINIGSVEGRDWVNLLKTLCGPHRPVVRPTIGCYHEPMPEELIMGIDSMRQMVHHLGETVDLWPELENYPFSRFSKSLQTTFLQMVLCQLAGLNGIMLNLYDFLGTPIAEEPDSERLLFQSRPFLNTLADLISRTGPVRGIGLLSHLQQALYRRTDGAKAGYSQLLAQEPWSVTLPLLGWSTTFGDASVVAMAGEKIMAYSNKKIEKMLRGGCLLEATAATALVERGYGEWIGIERTELIPGTYSGYLSEEITDAEAIGGVRERLSAWLYSGSKYRLVPRTGARVVTKLVSAYYQPIHGLVLYENKEGGRTAVFAYDGNRNGLGLTFRSWKRQRMMESIICWLGRGPAPLFLRGATNVLPLRRDGKRFILLGLANLSPDTMSQAELVLGQVPINAVDWHLKRLNEKGRLESVSQADVKQTEHGLEINCRLNLKYMEIAVLFLQP